MISLDLFGIPTPCARPRFNSITKTVYEDDKQKKLKEGAKWQLKSQYRNDPICGAVLIDITFFMPLPKASKTRTLQMLNGMIHPIVKPDIDNLQKFVLDVLNGLVIEDDKRVVEIRARKIYSKNPGTNIRVFPLNAEIYAKLYDTLDEQLDGSDKRKT